jgi:hypothetical protein
VKATVFAATVHRESFGGKPLKSLIAEMLSTGHCSTNPSKRRELLLLTTQKRVSFEEGNHSLEQVLSASNDQHVGVVIRATVVFTKPSTAEHSLCEI